MEETTIQSMIYDLEKNHIIEHTEIIRLLRIALINEKKQIKEAFEEGMKYGANGMFPHCDHPANKYYTFTYEKGILKEKL
jgi:hemerythrin